MAVTDQASADGRQTPPGKTAAPARGEAAAPLQGGAAAPSRPGTAESLGDATLLDTLLQPVFDAIAEAASRACDVPIALVSILDADRQWFKANVGLPGVSETPRAVAFCDHAVRQPQLFEVPDAVRDPRFAHNPLVIGDPGIRFYAGAPITLGDGDRIGTVCVIDRTPRQLSDAQRATLQGLSGIASACVGVAGRHAAAAREIAARDARYRSIVEDQTELISLAGCDGTLTYVNPAYARHFGRTPEQMTGRNLFDFVQPDDRATVQAHWDDVWRGGSADASTNRMLAADGQSRWVQWTNRPLLGADGQVVAMQSVGRDITEQKVTQDALQASELRFRSLYEATPALMHSIDAQGRLLSVSDLWLKVLGYQRHEVIGRHSAEFLAADSARRARDVVLPAFFRSGRCDQIDYQYVRKDGGLVDVLLSGRLERDADGAPLRSFAVLEDVTERKHMAAELTRTHASLDTIVENVPALLGQWDSDGITRFANREFQAALGLPPEQIVGRPLRALYDAVDPLAYDSLAPHVAQVLQGRQQEFELAMLTTSGLRQLRMTLVPDRAGAGQQIVGYYGLAYDITGHKALELRLTDSEQRYRALFEHLNSGFALHEIIVAADGTPVDYRFLAMNGAFAAMTGLVPALVIGQRVTAVLPGIEADPAGWIGVFGRVVASGEPAHFEQRSALLDRWFDVVAYRPAPGQFAVVAQDVTARKQADERLQAALKEKETLLKEVYHRVKNNLQVVQSLLNLQRRSLPPGAASAAFDDTVQRVRAMALVHEKLYRSGNLAALSLPDYSADLLRQIGDAHGAGQRRLRISADIVAIETGLDSAIPFGLLVTELVGNALKHAFPAPAAPAGVADNGVNPANPANPAGMAGMAGIAGIAGEAGHVRVTLSKSPVAGDGMLLSVADDGAGLPPGFALATSRSMGLQLATSLARQLGGDLRAATGGGPGATFTARLPRLGNAGTAGNGEAP